MYFNLTFVRHNLIEHILEVTGKQANKTQIDQKMYCTANISKTDTASLLSTSIKHYCYLLTSNLERKEHSFFLIAVPVVHSHGVFISLLWSGLLCFIHSLKLQTLTRFDIRGKQARCIVRVWPLALFVEHFSCSQGPCSDHGGPKQLLSSLMCWIGSDYNKYKTKLCYLKQVLIFFKLILIALWATETDDWRVHSSIIKL